MSRHLSNMTPVKLLALYTAYLKTQGDVAFFMSWAIVNFERGDEEGSWVALFEWEEAKEYRTDIWRKLQDHYPRALCIKEGVMS